MALTHSILLTGASGVGKSTLIRGALEHYGSGLIVLAPGRDEYNSYVSLHDNPAFVFGDFDDIMYQPALDPKSKAEGYTQMVRWLKERFLECQADQSSGKAIRYKVLAVDTMSGIGRLAYNQTLSRFQLSEPPAAIGSSGAPFYSYLRNTLESGVRLMRAIRGLGVHWLMASHPTEAEATQIQLTEGAKISSKIMPDLPGGFKNVLPSYFDIVVDVNIDSNGKHYIRWGGDARRVTKSRFGTLAEKQTKLELPDNALMAWGLVDRSIQQAVNKLTGGEK